MSARRLLCLLVVLCLRIPVPAGAFDFGVSVANATGLTWKPDAALTQRDKASLWANGLLGSRLYLNLQASYAFDLARPYFFDLDALSLTYRGQLSLQLGRFYFSDFTGFVLGHTLDGARARLLLPFGTITAGVAYAGLMQAAASTIVMSKSDLADREDERMRFGALRLVEQLEISFQELLLRQALRLSVVLQQDLRPAARFVGAGSGVQTQYFGLGLTGPLVSPVLYYDSYFYLESGATYPDAPILAFLTGGSLRLYLEKALGSRLALGGFYSSGDSDQRGFYEGNTAGWATQFVPVSRAVLGSLFSPQIGNVFLAELSYSFLPAAGSRFQAIRNTQIRARGVAFFRSTTGSISEEGLDPASGALYLGTVGEVSLVFRPLSDLGLVVAGTAFLPNVGPSGAFLPGGMSPRFQARLELSVSF